MREEKCSRQQINSLEWHGTTAQGKVYSIGLIRLFWSSLAYESKLSQQKRLENLYTCRLCCIQPPPKISGHESGRIGKSVGGKKITGRKPSRIAGLEGQRTQISKEPSNNSSYCAHTALFTYRDNFYATTTELQLPQNLITTPLTKKQPPINQCRNRTQSSFCH